MLQFALSKHRSKKRKKERKKAPSYYYEMLENIDLHSAKTTVTAAGLTCDLVDGAGGVHVEQGASQRARLFKAPSVGAGFGLHQA